MAKLLEEVKKKAYEAAEKAAIAKVKELEKEAEAYWQELLAKLAALANAPKNAAADAAAKAAEPYFKLALRTGDLVNHYNTQANDLVKTAKQMVSEAFKNANLANVEQANGQSET